AHVARHHRHNAPRDRRRTLHRARRRAAGVPHRRGTHRPRADRWRPRHGRRPDPERCTVSAIPWAEIITLAHGVITLAIEIARVIEASGCTVEDCPHDVRAHLNTAPIPAEDERMLDARAKAV